MQHLLLADVTIKGVKRKVIMQANKNGFLYDRPRQRQVLLRVRLSPRVNWALGLDGSDGPADHQSGNQKYSATESVKITPGSRWGSQLVADEFQPDTRLAVSQRPVGRRVYLRGKAGL